MGIVLSMGEMGVRGESGGSDVRRAGGEAGSREMERKAGEVGAEASEPRRGLSRIPPLGVFSAEV